MALLRAQAKVLELAKTLDGDEATGAKLVARALEEPLKQIAVNAGLEGGVIVEKVRSLKGANGLNAATGEYEDLVKAGVIDAAKVTRSALQNAASIAALFLTTEAVVADKPEEKGAGGMPRRHARRHGRHGRLLVRPRYRTHATGRPSGRPVRARSATWSRRIRYSEWLSSGECAGGGCDGVNAPGWAFGRARQGDDGSQRFRVSAGTQVVVPGRDGGRRRGARGRLRHGGRRGHGAPLEGGQTHRRREQRPDRFRVGAHRRHRRRRGGRRLGHHGDLGSDRRGTRQTRGSTSTCRASAPTRRARCG